MAFTQAHRVPVNALHAQGFPSIGCAPCTRAVAPGEPERAGRWWWEQESAKECGLHVGPDGRLQRAEARGGPRMIQLTHLQKLEAEAIHIIREVAATCENPVLLYSIGKDSAVLLHLVMKAFAPGKPPFPLLHVDTTWKFREMIAFRDARIAELGLELIVHINEEGRAAGVNPFASGSRLHTDVMKTQALRQALDKYKFDAAFGGARRDEESSRAKERIFSLRSPSIAGTQKASVRNPGACSTRASAPAKASACSRCRTGPKRMCGITSRSKNPVVPLYFAKPRPVVARDGMLIMRDDERMALRAGEEIEMRSVRFRTLGCYPLTGAVESTAATLPEIIAEMRSSRVSERQGRLIDHDGGASMEQKKQEGYF